MFYSATLIRERRRDGDVIAWLLIVAFGLAAWRGASGAPVLAVVMAVLALGVLAGWIAWRRAPASQITIAPTEVTFGRPEKVVMRIPRDAQPLKLRRYAVRQTGWWLTAREDSGAPPISLIGFDPATVRDECVKAGWEFVQ